MAFSSNRSGVTSVYTVAIDGGEPTRLSWYPATASVRGWTPDGQRILYASNRATAPSNYNRLWTVSKNGGPSTMLAAPWANDGAYSPNGEQLIIDRMRRWDTEWRAYRGGQNTPLVLLNVSDLVETQLPNESTVDIQPIWVDDMIYFLSDRDWTMNIWSYNPATKAVTQVTNFKEADVKALDGVAGMLVFEREGYLHTYNLTNNTATQLNITVKGDFPWSENKWEQVEKQVSAAHLSPSGLSLIHI